MSSETLGYEAARDELVEVVRKLEAGGLSLEETGHVLEVSEKTVERDWQAARAWLFRELSARPAVTGHDA